MIPHSLLEHVRAEYTYALCLARFNGNIHMSYVTWMPLQRMDTDYVTSLVDVSNEKLKEILGNKEKKC